MSNNTAATFLSGSLITDTYTPPNGSSDSIPELSKNINGVISSALEIHSTSGGVLIPRMTTAQLNLLNPDDGLMVFDTTAVAFKFRQGGAWVVYNAGGAGYGPGAPTFLQDTFGTTNNLGVGTPLKVFGTGTQSVIIGDNALLANTTGGALSGLGYSVLQSNTTGIENVAIGTLALNLNTTGSDNSAIGSTALSANIIGNGNTAVGSNALTNSTSDGNSGFGFRAGIANTTGTISAFGRNALASNTTGLRNSAFGDGALATSVTENDCTAFGFNALNLINNAGTTITSAFGAYSAAQTTTGTNIDAFGYQCLYANTTGGGNAGFGVQSMFNNTTGEQNVACGGYALWSNISGSDNCAVGYGALGGNAALTGNCSSNNAVGAFSLTVLQGGSFNCAFGYATLQAIINADNNCAFGHESLFNNTVNSNSAFGFQTGRANTTGTISAFGFHALLANTTGTNNCAFGSASLSAIIAGSNSNSAFGDNSGLALTSGSNNLFIGVSTGGQATLNQCSFLGYNATASANTLTNATAVGANAVVAISNSLILGNGANVGIGTSSPQNTLHVVGVSQFQGLASSAPSSVIKTQYTFTQSGSISIPIDTTFFGTNQVVVHATISYVQNHTTLPIPEAGLAAYATSTAAVLHDSDTPGVQATGPLPSITFTSSDVTDVSATWSVGTSSINLNLTTSAPDTVTVISVEYYSAFNPD